MADIREQVREKYALAAVQGSGGAGCCGGGGSCGPSDEAEKFGAGLYDASDLVDVPLEAQLVSLGCGNPLAVAELREGERVLDLGRAAASTSCSPPSASAPAASRTAST